MSDKVYAVLEYGGSYDTSYTQTKSIWDTKEAAEEEIIRLQKEKDVILGKENLEEIEKLEKQVYSGLYTEEIYNKWSIMKMDYFRKQDIGFYGIEEFIINEKGI